ncbi:MULTISPECIES: fumarylacetoacetate hydrolase family protein [unclassified Beijerinckia]|uniref:fumarylacetoacetate hydrolase family protein n=1 Tax=unclassified Beijerinckia TaxID=2638183 RepID=UPI000897D1D2|nr:MULTISPECIES: fumarylacetoacetate hydrolase family protein [unclassified Beijerinckia]MDH7795564.1 2,4-diketo-3-deoxy-L-fuconate hydrolase [Beijerinckia sp. GAS462]SEC06824.1 2-keto-4-pentenoate hydratase/2-oxohepta-3-ene-1,7-dioic acid hydratase (catechol pathway) [Beijerinckia sp. 28-YEA-48]
MRICRFDANRIGVVKGDKIHDVTDCLDRLPALRYPFPQEDQLVAHLDELLPAFGAKASTTPGIELSKVKLENPVANPSKVIGVPSNYKKHIEEAGRDPMIGQGRPRQTLKEAGLFLKANTALCGSGDPLVLHFPDRRTDHELELVAVIGRKAKNITEAEALDHVAGYAIGLDMTLRGAEDRSLRKSIDTYATVGPWLVTRDEIANPDCLDMTLWIDGEKRQSSNTQHMIYNVAQQIAIASTFYTLLPGDIIMTGTPEGVGPVKSGEHMRAEIEGIGAMEIRVL